MTNHLIHAYQQTPWRLQLQWIGLFLLVVVFLASVGSIYLNVSASAAATGREIQDLEDEKTTLGNSIADLETQLALLTSSVEMEKRAKALGFHTSEPADTLYMVFPNYTGRKTAVLAPQTSGLLTTSQPIIRSTYRQSLLEWLFEGISNRPIGESWSLP